VTRAAFGGMSTNRVLITGGGGQLASDLEQVLAASSTVSAPSHRELDIIDDDGVRRSFDDFRPTVVFNCAAFHNVEVCEREEDRAFAVNARAVKRLAERCAEYGTTLVHMSTNYVFDGERPEPYTERDIPSPRSTYAMSKLAGEHAARAYAADVVVVRTAGLYGLHGSSSKGGNFVTRMVATARDRGELKMVADQRLSPTYTAHLARALVEAVESGRRGVFHLTSSGECSWYEFTTAIMELAAIDARIEPVETTRSPGAADRPLNGVLARPVADAAGLVPLPSWHDGLTDYMERAGLRR
jgi:dTDP-4-dehydrorhamnose reductase